MRRASAGAQLSENMRAAPRRERHFALSRAMCTASRSCHEFRKADDKKVHAEKKHVDIVWFLTGRMAPPAWGCLRRPRGMCAASYSWHAFRIVDDKTGHVERKNVDFDMVFFSQDGRARIDVRARCAPRPIPAAHFASSTTGQAMLRGKT